MSGRMNWDRVNRVNRERGTHVGVISNGSDLTSAQQVALSRTLTQIALDNPGRLILHHGCGRGTDEFAHRFARRLSGWRIRGHPLHDAPGTPPAPAWPLSTGLIRSLSGLEGRDPSQDCRGVSLQAGAAHQRRTEEDSHGQSRRGRLDRRGRHAPGHPHRGTVRRPRADAGAASGGRYQQGVRPAAAWADGEAAGRPVAWAIEGTRHYGLGLARYLAGHGRQVAEIDATWHVGRRRAGKSDPIDAVRAARELLARPHPAQMRADGEREILRLLMLDRDNAVASAKTARTVLASVLVTAPAALRDELRTIPAERRYKTCARWPARPEPTA